MKAGVCSHYNSSSYWSFYAADHQIKNLSSKLNKFVNESTQKPGQRCFFFDGESGAAVFARHFRASETRPNPKDDRGLCHYRAVFHFDEEELEWLLEVPERLAAFQTFIASEFIYLTIDDYKRVNGVFPLPREAIDQLRENGLPQGDQTLIRSIQLAVIEDWVCRLQEKKGQTRRLFYYERSDQPEQIPLPLLQALAGLPRQLRRISIWLPLTVGQEDSPALRKLQGVNAVWNDIQRPLPRGIQLPIQQDFFSEPARSIHELLCWMNQSDIGRRNMNDLDQNMAGPEQWIKTLLSAVELKAALAAGPTDSRYCREIFFDSQLSYFLSEAEFQELTQRQKMSQVPQEAESHRNHRVHKNKPGSCVAGRLLTALVVLVLLSTSLFINAQVIAGSQQQWIIQINAAPAGITSQLMIFIAGVLCGLSLKNPR